MSKFEKAFHGKFESLLHWEEFDAFWARLKADDLSSWYIHVPGESAPNQVAPLDKTEEFLHEVEELIKKEHQERYCAIVYVDDKSEPNIIKIYDPGNLGVSCGYSENPPLPAWVMSKIKPEHIDRFKDAWLSPNNRKRWWQKIFQS